VSWSGRARFLGHNKTTEGDTDDSGQERASLSVNEGADELRAQSGGDPRSHHRGKRAPKLTSKRKPEGNGDGRKKRGEERS